MWNKTLIALLCLAFTFCNNLSVKKKSRPGQLDSLVSFDSIVAIYTHGSTPPMITDDALEEEDSRPPLHIDSVERWTTSPEIIRAFKKKFPALKGRPSFIEFTCCGYRELLVETSKQSFRLSWNVNTSDSTIMFDTIAFIGDKNIFDKLSQLPERKIISKEILLKDTIYNNFADVYNQMYWKRNSLTQFVYFLR